MTKIRKRDTFNSKLGFTIACIGSAVGMGNIWLFPYRTGQFGGAAFLIPYFFICNYHWHCWCNRRNGIWKSYGVWSHRGI